MNRWIGGSCPSRDVDGLKATTGGRMVGMVGVVISEDVVVFGSNAGA